MKTVPLSGKHAAGRVALIDDADAELVAPYSWYADPHRHTLYARAHVPGSGIHGQDVYMHTLLAGLGADHRNGDGLDNQRANLRPATASQNAANSRPRNASKLKGISWDASRGRWKAQITVDYQHRDLGRFASKEDAARAYDAAALAAWGDYARLNFPEKP